MQNITLRKGFVLSLLFSIILAFLLLSENLNILLIIPFLLIAFFIHPIYILFLIILLNPLSDLIVIKYPSLITKFSIDILILMFIYTIILRKIIDKEKLMKYPFYKWIFVIFIFYIISGLANWTSIENFLFMNWLHFRFIYLAIAITLLNYDYKKFTQLINLLLIAFIFQICIGVFQVVGGEWAKSLFYSYGDYFSLSFRMLEFRSYDTASSFNPATSTYIYSTFYLPGHYGGFLLIMLCLMIGFKIVLIKKKRNISTENMKLFYFSLISNKNKFLILCLLTVMLIILTYSRSAYLGLIALISILIFLSNKPFISNFLYVIFLILSSLLIANVEVLIDYVKDIKNPTVDIFDPISRFFSIFPTYLLENTPRKIAYYEILPLIFIQKPIFGLGVTSALNRDNLFFNSFELNNALFYVYGDTGIVRLFVEYGVIGTLLFGILFISVFMYAKKGYYYSDSVEYKAICLTVMFGIIISIPLNVGTMLMLSKPFGLYLWFLIGLSQKWKKII